MMFQPYCIPLVQVQESFYAKESEPLRFQGVTAEGLVTVMLGIAEGCALQSALNNEPVDVAQVLAALRALLGSVA